jgi:hypothetical protein
MATPHTTPQKCGTQPDHLLPIPLPGSAHLVLGRPTTLHEELVKITEDALLNRAGREAQ